MNDTPHAGDVVLDYMEDTHNGINPNSSAELSEDSLPDITYQPQAVTESDEVRDATEHFEGMSSLPEQDVASERRKIGLFYFCRFICQVVIGILSCLKAVCVFCFQKKCETIIILQILLLFLRVTRLMEPNLAARLSFCLIVLGLIIGCFGCADVNRQRTQFRRANRLRRSPYSLDESLNNTLRGMIVSQMQLSQIREYLEVLNQQRNAEDLENPVPRPNPFRIHFSLGDLHMLDSLILSHQLMRNAQPESRGLSKESIDQLMPEQRYQIQENLEVIEHQQGAEGENEEYKNCCTICLEEFQPDQEVRISPCLHTFHTACVDSWLSIRNVCPNCKQEIGQVENNPAPNLFLPSFAHPMQNVLHVEANLSQPRSIPQGDNASIASYSSDENSD